MIQPGKWQELGTARSAVQARPEDGQAWLNLASLYRSLATMGYNTPSVFSTSYLPLGIEAYRKAAELLPEHPAPHAGLALLTLAPYMRDKNAPPEVIQSVQAEFNTARELEAKNPSLAEEADISSGMVEESLSIYFYNDATATAEWAAWSTDWARETADAASMQTPSATPALEPTLTPTPLPSATPHPLPSALPTPTTPAGGGQSLLIILAAVGIGLVIVGYLALKRLRGAGTK